MITIRRDADVDVDVAHVRIAVSLAMKIGMELRFQVRPCELTEGDCNYLPATCKNTAGCRNINFGY